MLTLKSKKNIKKIYFNIFSKLKIILKNIMHCLSQKPIDLEGLLTSTIRFERVSLFKHRFPPIIVSKLFQGKSVTILSGIQIKLYLKKKKTCRCRCSFCETMVRDKKIFFPAERLVTEKKHSRSECWSIVFQIVEFLKIREKGWHSKAGTPLEQLS